MSATMAKVCTEPQQRVTGAADPWLLGAVIALLALGLIMVYSAVTATATDAEAALGKLAHHGVAVAIGAAALLAAYRAPLDCWRVLSGALLVLAGLLLVLVLVPGIGIEVNGSRRWLPLGPVRMQPSELAKLALVVHMAAYLACKHDAVGQLREGIVYPSAIVAAFAVLLLLEPDFGSAVVLAATVSGMLFLAGVRLLHFLVGAGVAAAGMVALALLAPYRMARLTSFMDPWSDPFGSGFQLVQALIAFGRGEWLGVGLGGSVQKLHYLPHASTDFLLAVIAEELGLVGVAVVLALFTVILWRAFAIAREARRGGRLFAARLAQGLGLLLVLQAVINIGVNMGVLPTKGLTLPMLSYGGSSLIVSCAAAGLLLAAGRPAAAGERSAPLTQQAAA